MQQPLEFYLAAGGIALIVLAVAVALFIDRRNQYKNLK